MRAGRKRVRPTSGLRQRATLAAALAAVSVLACGVLGAAASAATAAPAGIFGTGIWRLAGSGSTCATKPACGDGGLATSAQLSGPTGVAADGAGNVYIADTGDQEIRKVSPTGTITRFAGNGTYCDPPFCGDGGPAVNAQLNRPWGVAADGAGNVYITDVYAYEVRKVSPGGTITRLAGTGHPCASTGPTCFNGPLAVDASFHGLSGVGADSAGNVYISDPEGHVVDKVTRAGTIVRFAGTGKTCGTPPSCGDNGLAINARLNFPDFIATDSAGDVYISDEGTDEVREVSPAGTITRVAGNGKQCTTAPFCGDGAPATSAQLNAPTGIALDANNNLYIADTNDFEVRQVASTGTITTVAGDAQPCSSNPCCGDGGAATNAQLTPHGVAAAPGAVDVVDPFVNEVHKIAAATHLLTPICPINEQPTVAHPQSTPLPGLALDQRLAR